VKHDDLFKTTTQKLGGFKMPRLHWQELSGFAKSETPVPQVDCEEERQPAERNQQSAEARPKQVVEQSNDNRGFEGDNEGTIGEENEPPNPMSQLLPVVEEDETTKDDAVELTDNNEVTLQLPHPIEGAGCGRTRSGRKIKIMERSTRGSQYQWSKKWVAWLAGVLSARPSCPGKMKSMRYSHIQDCASDPITFSATSDTYTMYWHQAMQEPDRAKFLKAAEAEVKSQVDNQHFV
jgi:hypothetical protein